eukprot:PhF_6_TR41811/c0_g1_i1/m.63423
MQQQPSMYNEDSVGGMTDNGGGTMLDVNGNAIDPSSVNDLGDLDGVYYIVRLRGLPFQATEEDVHMFLGEPESGQTFFVFAPRGRKTGDAFVTFKSENEYKAALERHRQYMGSRYVEVYSSSEQEMNALREMSSCFPDTMMPLVGIPGAMGGMGFPCPPGGFLPPMMGGGGGAFSVNSGVVNATS